MKNLLEEIVKTAGVGEEEIKEKLKKIESLKIARAFDDPVPKWVWSHFCSRELIGGKEAEQIIKDLENELTKIEFKKTNRRRSGAIVTTPSSPSIFNNINPYWVEEIEGESSKTEFPRGEITNDIINLSNPFYISDFDTRESPEEAQPNQDFSFFEKFTKTIAENKNAFIVLAIISCFTIVIYFLFFRKKDKSN